MHSLPVQVCWQYFIFSSSVVHVLFRLLIVKFGNSQCVGDLSSHKEVTEKHEWWSEFRFARSAYAV